MCRRLLPVSFFQNIIIPNSDFTVDKNHPKARMQEDFENGGFGQILR
jgi:hypothetical protein